MKKEGFHPEPHIFCFLRENKAWAVYLQDLAVRTALQLPYVKIQTDCTLSSLWAELCFHHGRPLLVACLESEPGPFFC